MEPPIRLELMTVGLQNRCSTNWAMVACVANCIKNVGSVKNFYKIPQWSLLLLFLTGTSTSMNQFTNTWSDSRKSSLWKPWSLFHIRMSNISRGRRLWLSSSYWRDSREPWYSVMNEGSQWIRSILHRWSQRVAIRARISYSSFEGVMGSILHSSMMSIPDSCKSQISYFLTLSHFSYSSSRSIVRMRFSREVGIIIVRARKNPSLWVQDRLQIGCLWSLTMRI